ncbi:MAG TPA: hypothetical protein DCY61_01000 [Dehalococcoidia bacterium]|nr:hypothetical protein [Dehalococcoidia bacterium]
MPRILRDWEQAKLVEKNLVACSGAAFSRRLSLSEEIRRALIDWANLQDVLTKARTQTSRPQIALKSELRRSEIEWLVSHSEELKQYQNQWVAIEGDKVVAHGGSEEEVDNQARSQGIVVPFLLHIPAEDEAPFIGGISTWP